MLKRILFMTALLGAITLTACSKESNDADEHNQLAAELNASATPSASWSDQQLDDYEAKLNRLQVLEHSPNVLMLQDNSQAIAQRRRELEEARSQKRNQATSVRPSSSSSNPNISLAKPSLASIRDQVLGLMSDAEKWTKQLNSGAPDLSWTTEQLNADIVAIDHYSADGQKLIEIISQTPELSQSQSKLPALQQELSNLQQRRAVDQKILDNRTM